MPSTIPSPAPSDAQSYYQQSPARMARARAAAPDVSKAFAGMFQAIMKDSGGSDGGGMSLREKELIALGIGLAVRCDSCIYAHVEKALRAGATRQQIIETAGVAVLMQGGPTYTYLPKIVEALDALQEADHVP